MTVSNEDPTDRLVAEGAARGVNRQCSIGWHQECSDPHGDECGCACHTDGAVALAAAKTSAFDEFWAGQPEGKVPSMGQLETFSRYDFMVGWEAAMRREATK